jgi:hypothetical protein
VTSLAQKIIAASARPSSFLRENRSADAGHRRIASAREASLSRPGGRPTARFQLEGARNGREGHRRPTRLRDAAIACEDERFLSAMSAGQARGIEKRDSRLDHPATSLALRLTATNLGFSTRASPRYLRIC